MSPRCFAQYLLVDTKYKRAFPLHRGCTMARTAPVTTSVDEASFPDIKVSAPPPLAWLQTNWMMQRRAGRFSGRAHTASQRILVLSQSAEDRVRILRSGSDRQVRFACG